MLRRNCLTAGEITTPCTSACTSSYSFDSGGRSRSTLTNQNIMQILLPEFEMTWACSYVCNNQKALGLHQHCELHQHRELQHSNALSKSFSNVIAAIDTLFAGATICCSLSSCLVFMASHNCWQDGIDSRLCTLGKSMQVPLSKLVQSGFRLHS